MSARHDERRHDGLEPLIAAAALDGLDEPQREELARLMAEHGPDCPECRRLTAEYTEVAAGIAASIEPMPVSAPAEAALIRRAREVSSPARLEQARARRVRRWVAAAAVAAGIALVGGVAGYAIAPRGGGVPGDFVAFASGQGTRIVPFPAQGGQQLAVAFRQGQPGGWIIGSGVSSLPKGRVYELWFQPDPNAAVQPAGTFVPDDGNVLAPMQLGGSFNLIAVSVEPEGGSPQPTTTPIFVATT